MKSKQKRKKKNLPISNREPNVGWEQYWWHSNSKSERGSVRKRARATMRVQGPQRESRSGRKRECENARAKGKWARAR